MKIIIAQPNDASAIAEILKLGFQEIKALYTLKAYEATVISAHQAEERIQEGIVWLALVRGKPAGTISGILSGSSIYIQSMAVVPEARGLQVGLKLLETVQQCAEEKNCTTLLLSTSPYLKKAIRIYEKFGFEITNDPPYELEGVPLFSMAKGLG